MNEIILIGTYSNYIGVYDFKNGRLKMIGEINNIINPSFLCINQNMLYTVSETKQGSIMSLKLDNNTIKKIDYKILEQSLPCYITTNNKDKLLVTNYESGSVIMYKIEENGIIGKEISRKQYQNANMHFAEFIEDEIYVTDLGNDKIYIFDLYLELKYEIKIDAKSGPRHLITTRERMYVITEFTNEVLVYHKCGNRFRLIQKVSTLLNKDIPSYGAAIKISSDSKNLYVTNRGDNSISVFEINEKGIRLIQNISSYGEFPRDILLNQND